MKFEIVKNQKVALKVSKTNLQEETGKLPDTDLPDTDLPVKELPDTDLPVKELPDKEPTDELPNRDGSGAKTPTSKLSTTSGKKDVKTTNKQTVLPKTGEEYQTYITNIGILIVAFIGVQLRRRQRKYYQ